MEKQLVKTPYIRSNEFISNTLILIIRDKSIDGEYVIYFLNHQDGRDTMINDLLSMKVYKTVNNMKIKFIGKDCRDIFTNHDLLPYSKDLKEQILQYEFIKHHTKLYQCFRIISSEIKKPKNNRIKAQYLLYLTEIIRILFWNTQLLFPHIFNYNKSVIWKPLLWVLLTALLAYVSKISDNRFAKNVRKAWNSCFLALLSTIKYWKYRHFVFAINNGLCEMLTICWRRDLYLLKDDYWERSIDCERMDITLALFHEMQMTLSKMKRYKNKHSALKCIQIGLKNESVDYDDLKLEIDCRMQNDFWSVFYSSPLQCGWPMCQKTQNQFNAKNKCKGCKLVCYCCRNHQKKHWKYMHSDQCLRIKC